MSAPNTLPAGTVLACLFCGYRETLAVDAPAWFILHCPSVLSCHGPLQTIDLGSFGRVCIPRQRVRCGAFGPLSTWAAVARSGKRRRP